MRVREVIIGDQIFLEIDEDPPTAPKEKERESPVWIGDLVPDIYDQE